MKKLLIFSFIVVALIFLFQFFFTFSQMGNKAMEPSIQFSKYLVFLNRTFFYNIYPSRGNIVLYNDLGRLGRVVGLPNEIIALQEGELYVSQLGNQYKLKEKNVKRNSSNDSLESITLSKDEFLAIPDDYDGLNPLSEYRIKISDVKGVLVSIL